MKNDEPEIMTREQLIEAMLPELKALADDWSRIDRRFNRGGVLLRHLWGERILEIKAERARYGSRAVEQLATYFGATASALYDFGTFAETFNRAEVESLLAREMPNGRSLNLYHFFAVMRIASPEVRIEFLERALAEGWSARCLMDEIQLVAPKKRRTSRGGRKPATPRTPIACAAEIIRSCRQLSAILQVSGAILYDGIDDLPPDELTQPLLVKVRDGLELCEQLRDRLHLRIGQLRAFIARAEASQSSRAAGETSIETEPGEHQLSARST